MTTTVKIILKKTDSKNSVEKKNSSNISMRGYVNFYYFSDSNFKLNSDLPLLGDGLCIIAISKVLIDFL